MKSLKPLAYLICPLVLLKQWLFNLVYHRMNTLNGPYTLNSLHKELRVFCKNNHIQLIWIFKILWRAETSETNQLNTSCQNTVMDSAGMQERKDEVLLAPFLLKWPQTLKPAFHLGKSFAKTTSHMQPIWRTIIQSCLQQTNSNDAFLSSQIPEHQTNIN